MASSFTGALEKSGSIPIHLVRCKDTSGRDCYFFVMCQPQKIKALKAVQSGPFDVRDYGKIIASGFGREPPEATKQRLKKDYRFDADSLLN